jgi:hypothetical protein
MVNPFHLTAAPHWRLMSRILHRICKGGKYRLANDTIASGYRLAAPAWIDTGYGAYRQSVFPCMQMPRIAQQNAQARSVAKDIPLIASAIRWPFQLATTGVSRYTPAIGSKA